MTREYIYVRFLFVLVVALLLTSCGSRRTAINMQPTTTEQVTQSVEEIKRDTVLVIPADKSQYVADLAIQGNMIVVKDANIKRSKNKVLQLPKVQLVNNKLMVDCEVEAQQMFLEWKEKFIKEQRVIETKIPIAVPLELSTWQQTQIWLGRTLLLLMTLGSVGYGLRSRV